jgi:hypothetical protein
MDWQIGCYVYADICREEVGCRADNRWVPHANSRRPRAIYVTTNGSRLIKSRPVRCYTQKEGENCIRHYGQKM